METAPGRLWRRMALAIALLVLAFPPATRAARGSGAGTADAVEAIAGRSYEQQARATILARSTLERQPRRTSRGSALDPVLLERTERYDALTAHYSSVNGLDAPLVRAVIYAESGGDRQARSRQGAAGLMQLMPATARQYGAADPYDAEQSIASGARYLKALMDRFGSVELALWAYNAGPAAVERGNMPTETQDYVPRVLRLRRAFASRTAPLANIGGRQALRY